MLNFNIKDFFKRINSIQGRGIEVRQAIQQTCKEIINIEFKLEDINIKNGVVNIKNLSGVAKSALYIKKESILDRINSIQSTQKISDIR